MSDGKRLLATTALEASWGEGKPVLFLGEWCRMYNRKPIWSKIDSDVLPYHWDDREKLNADFDYLYSLYERLLPKVSSKLNAIHRVNYSEKYWRILIGPWLAYFLHTLFDRWENIQIATRKGNIDETIVLGNDILIKTPASIGQFFSEMVSNHEWNHFICAFILKNYTRVKCTEIKYEVEKKIFNEPSQMEHVNMKSIILKFYSKISRFFVKNEDLFFISTYLSPLNEMKLHLQFKQFPQLWKTEYLPDLSSELLPRTWNLNVKGLNQFEECLLKLLPNQIPIAYIEGYQKVIEQVKSLPWPKFPKIIFTANALWHDTVSMFYSAYQIEKGAKLIYGQHGGFGILETQWAEVHERKIADKYLTWGWTEKKSSNLVPVGILKPVSKYKNKKGEKKKLLMVRGGGLPYTFRIDSSIGLSQLKEDMENSFSFARLLSEKIRKTSLIVRLYPLAYAFSTKGQETEKSSIDFLGEEDKWKKQMPEVRLSCSPEKISDLVVQSKIVIYTYNGGTGYLEFIGANVPVIVFWSNKKVPIRTSAISYFEELKRVGVFHESPESLANHIHRVWDDVSGWWSNKGVQDVIKKFKKNYCYRPHNIVANVKNAISNNLSKAKLKKDNY